MHRAGVALAILFALAAAAGQAVHAGGVAAGPGCEPRHVPYLGRACQLPTGLYAVQLDDGLVLHTHGPDPRTDAAVAPLEAGSPERPLVCSEGARMEVLYGHPQGSPDRLGAVAEDIRAALRRANHLLAEDAVASGGPEADFRVACDGGDIRVSGFTGPATGSAAYTVEYDGIVQAARDAGHTRKETDYLVFYDAGSTVCGVGNLYGDSRLSADNDNMVETGYGIVYDGCWFGRTPMHENGHTQGAVQDLAPMWDGSGHCLEGLDVMCYPGEDGVAGTLTLGLLHECGDRLHYDCNHDTYFDAAPEPGEWLASHWNIGDPVNRYLAFGGEDAVPEPSSSESSSPTASSSASPTSSPSPTKSASASTSPSPTARPVAAPRATTSAASTPDDGGLALGPGQDTPGVPPALVALGLLAVAGAAARRRLGP